jgi:hypothetical protein
VTESRTDSQVRVAPAAPRRRAAAGHGAASAGRYPWCPTQIRLPCANLPPPSRIDCPAVRQARAIRETKNTIAVSKSSTKAGNLPQGFAAPVQHRLSGQFGPVGPGRHQQTGGLLYHIILSLYIIRIITLL